ncbi:hydantoinase/oxoprolinase family protein [candidate division CSSED10-310 bacterium]|uniref:Hydantoinase/oxoprolinase family protein n=1 Tax=candidate division CSSED10-310 bacterium TaxID=2855610 RepID=A0ABV6YSR4_UNCC1
MSYTIDIDTGGTYTDGYFYSGNSATMVKVETTPHDLTLGFLNCIARGALKLGFKDSPALLRETEVIRFSTTLCNNLLIQQKGPKLGLFVTSGHEKTLYTSPGHDIFQYLVAPEMVVGIDEEVDVEGNIISAPAEDEVVAQTRYLLHHGARMLVIALRGAPINPANERRIKEILDLEYPTHYLGHIPVLLSHQISVRPEDNWRTQAALINAYLHRELMNSLYKTEDAVRSMGSTRPLLIVHGNFGAARVAKTKAIDTYNSGPAAAQSGASLLARMMEHKKVIALDIGGTSTEICSIIEGNPVLQPHTKIAGLDTGAASSPITTLAGGGGSIAQYVAGHLSVGPASAGALPGPACYDLGGMDPTVTDAFLELGFLDPGYYLGGERQLNTEKASGALEQLAGNSGDSVRLTALKIVATLRNTIADAMTRYLSRQDFSQWCLYVFGGGGGLFAAFLAEKLGLRKIYTFPFGSVFSAFGSSTLEVVHIYESNLSRIGQIRDYRLILDTWFQNLIRISQKDMAGEGFDNARITYKLQLESQEAAGKSVLHDYAVSPGDTELPLQRSATAPYKLVMARLKAIAPLTHPQMREQNRVEAVTAEAFKGNRDVYWAETPVETPIHQQEMLQKGLHLHGPVIVESKFSTIIVPQGWEYTIDENYFGVLYQ